MALIEATLAHARSFTFFAVPAIPSPSFPPGFQRNAKSPIQSNMLLSKKSLSKCSQPDIEDSGNLMNTQKRRRVAESYLHRVRQNRGLTITDITSTEWCQKQMEYTLFYGAQKTNEAMRASTARHIKLQEEVIKCVEVKIKSHEDFWALKFINFINSVNQLQFEGVTRELPIIGFTEGVWMVGAIDEIRLPHTLSDRNPLLIDTKTRSRDTLPFEPQRRNGRYESQKDHSLLGEDKFAYDSKWLKHQIQKCIKFWLGEEEASYALEDERWKCKYCQYASVCYTERRAILPSNDSNIKESHCRGE